jgi:hypothetical protein
MKIDFLSYQPYNKPPRPWQAEFLESEQKGIVRYAMEETQKPREDRLPYVLNAFPGTGKTYACMLAASYLLKTGVIERIVYVVPWRNLKKSAKKTADDFGIELIMAEDPKHLLDLNDGYHSGAIVSYGMLGGDCSKSLAPMVRDFRTLVVADEMHHLEENKGWGAAFERVFGRNAHIMLMTTGTPIRSDGTNMPYVRYRTEGRMQRIITNFDHGYAEALNAQPRQDVLCINFTPWDGDVSWSVTPAQYLGSNDGPTEYTHGISENLFATYADRLPKAEIETLNADRLRHCVDVPSGQPGESDYLARSFADADAWLREVRSRTDPKATGLISCRNSCEHANQIADYIKRVTGDDNACTVIHGGSAKDDDGDNKAMKAHSNKMLDLYQRPNPQKTLPRWIVSVGMLKEGVDVPQLAALIYASNTVAPLTWIQIVGRILRIPLTDDHTFYANAWMPNTPEFRELMEGMRDALQDYKSREPKEKPEGPDGPGEYNPFSRRSTEGLGSDVEHDGSIGHDAEGTEILSEEQASRLRDAIPRHMSISQVMSMIRPWGDNANERIENFVKAATAAGDNR